MAERFKASILKIDINILVFIVGSNPTSSIFYKVQIAQLGLEHKVENFCVVGSNPTLNIKNY